MTVHFKPSALLLGALVAPGMLGASSVQAASSRWGDLSITQTEDDGLALVSASFDGQQVFGPTAVAYFTLDGQRYELTNSDRIAGPTVTRNTGFYQASATYRVNTPRGDVDVTVYHDFLDTDSRWADMGQMGSYAAFTGPTGTYEFFWRVDVDVEGASGDHFQIFGEKAGGRTLFNTPGTELGADLRDVPMWFDRIQAQVMDGPGYSSMSYVWLASQDVDARLFAVRNNPGENEANPSRLVNGEQIQSLVRGPVDTTDVGQDIVLWYSASVTGHEGLVGPTFLAKTSAARTGFLEMDKMKRTNFPPQSGNLDGNPNATIASAFASGAYVLNNVYYDNANVAYKRTSSYAELQGYLNEQKSYRTQESPTNWYSHMMIAQQLSGPLGPFVLGIMHDITGYDTNQIFREGAATLYGPLVKNYPCDGAAPNDCNSALLWTVSHETGHAYNLHHEDWCDLPTECASGQSNFYENTAIMGYSYDIATLHWTFGEKNGARALEEDPVEYVRPGYGVDFISENPYVYPYNTTEEHKNLHDPIE